MAKKNIEGIYNYCDRWCERCTFTNQCLNYEGNNKLSKEEQDITNKAFWNNISNNFTKAIAMLYEMAEKEGIDLDKLSTPEEDAAFEKKQNETRDTIKQHQLVKLCKQYQKIAMPFCNDSLGLVDKVKELNSHLHLGITNEEDVVLTVANIGDSFEIIQWYIFLIESKIQRALHGLIEDEGWEIENGFQRDCDGSAKIALISIERSMGAWLALYEQMPTRQDVALNTLALLSQIKKSILQNFPKAMGFKRPGFDD